MPIPRGSAARVLGGPACVLGCAGLALAFLTGWGEFVLTAGMVLAVPYAIKKLFE